MDCLKKICRLAGEAAVKYRMIADGDRILVGLSGGKDSFVLMHVLEHLRRRAPVGFELECATFDPGFPGFNAEAIAEYCRRNSWHHHPVKLNVDSVIEEKGFGDAPCVLCSRLRRGKLYGLAAKLGCSKLALGQHLDDIIASFMMSLCRGQGLTTMAPAVAPDSADAPQVIRPLALVPEALIKEYAASLNLPEAGACRYKTLLESGDRQYFRELTDILAGRIPDVRSNIMHSLGRVEIKHLLLTPDSPLLCKNS